MREIIILGAIAVFSLWLALILGASAMRECQTLHSFQTCQQVLR